MTDTGSRHAYRIGLAGLAVTSIGWGLNWPAMKFLLRELPPRSRVAAVDGCRMFVALLALVLRQDLRVPRRVRVRVAMAAAVNVFAWMGFATIALQWLDVSQTALLVYTMPIWATLIAWPLTGRAPSLRAAAGLLVCVAGLWTLFGTAAQGFDRSQIVGVGFALASAVLFAFGTVALRPVAEMAPLPLLAWQLGLGSLPMLAQRHRIRAARSAARQFDRLAADGLHDARADGPVLPDLVRRAAPASSGHRLDRDPADTCDRRRHGRAGAR